MNQLRMVDFFSGLGGFHAGLATLGVKCVLACEIDENLRDLYELNFGIRPHHDLRDLDARDVPAHDVLCAGFPCQPFSKAGEQLGLACERDGDLFRHLMRIIKARRPPVLLLENVANLLRHNGGATWHWMESQLKRLGYHVRTKILSPHRFGIPQIRERLFIVASMQPLDGFEWPEERVEEPHISSVLDVMPAEAKPLSKVYADCLAVWQEFLDAYPRSEPLPSFPIWTSEFGADYPIEGRPPSKCPPAEREHFHGAYGVALAGLSRAEQIAALPSYARAEIAFPKWKRDFIASNRALFRRNEKWIASWLPKILPFPASLRKLEWNCGDQQRLIARHIVQFRASGVRVKRPNWAPTLIAMTATQVPVIAAESRYMTVRECARLQGLGNLPALPSAPTRAYRALGNAVNAQMVTLVATQLLKVCSVRASCSGRPVAVAS